MNKYAKKFFSIVGVIFISSIKAFLESLFNGAIIWIVWNALAPTLDIPTLAFIQAWLIWLLLCMIATIFKGENDR